MHINIERRVECKMGNNPTAVFDVMLDGVSVATVKAKWHAQRIGAALFADQIEPTGDLVQRLRDWAYQNDRILFDRLPK